MNLKLITTEQFNNLDCNFYRSTNEDILLTREQSEISTDNQAPVNTQWEILNTISTSKKNINSYLGCVYVIEYGDYLKIGSTKNLRHRITTLERQADGYSDWKTGRAMHTPPHTNFYTNEKFLHGYFDTYRKGNTELFDITLSEFISSCPTLNFEDNTKERENNSKEFVKSFSKLFGLETVNNGDLVQMPKCQYIEIINQITSMQEIATTILERDNIIFQNIQQFTEATQSQQLQQQTLLQHYISYRNEMDQKIELLAKHCDESPSGIFHDLTLEVKNKYKINLEDYADKYWSDINPQTTDEDDLDLMDVIMYYPSVKKMFNDTINNLLSQNGIQCD